jgi:hypothetical protein
VMAAKRSAGGGIDGEAKAGGGGDGKEEARSIDHGVGTGDAVEDNDHGDGDDDDDAEGDAIDEEEETHRSSHRRSPASHDDRERLAPDACRMAAEVGGFVVWCGKRDWVKGRNLHEAEVLCAALDSLINNGDCTPITDGVEILVRRLLGLRTVEDGYEWSVANALSWTNPGELLSRSALKGALREAALRDKMASAKKTDKKSTSVSTYRKSGKKYVGGTGGGKSGGRVFDESKRGASQPTSAGAPRKR